MNDATLNDLEKRTELDPSEIQVLVRTLRESQAREAGLERRLKQMEENFDNECARAGKFFDALNSIANDKLAKEDGAYLQYLAREALAGTNPKLVGGLKL